MQRRHLKLAPIGPIAQEYSDEELLRVGDLAKATGKTVRAIHHYEQLGLIEPARRSKGSYRLFAPDAKVRIQWITKLQSLGLSLTDIQQVVAQRQTSAPARRAASELRGVYEERLAQVRTKLDELKQLERELEESVDYLESCSTACEHSVAVAVCDSCNHHDDSEVEPVLVAGARLH